MRALKGTLLAVVILSIPAAFTKSSVAIDLTGPWVLELAFPAQGILSMQFKLDLQQIGTTIAGTASGKRPVKGAVDGTKVTLTVNLEASIPGGIDVNYEGEIVDSNTLKGTVSYPGRGTANWTAHRQ